MGKKTICFLPNYTILYLTSFLQYAIKVCNIWIAKASIAVHKMLYYERLVSESRRQTTSISI